MHFEHSFPSLNGWTLEVWVPAFQCLWRLFPSVRKLSQSLDPNYWVVGSIRFFQNQFGFEKKKKKKKNTNTLVVWKTQPIRSWTHHAADRRTPGSEGLRAGPEAILRMVDELMPWKPETSETWKTTGWTTDKWKTTWKQLNVQLFRPWKQLKTILALRPMPVISWVDVKVRHLNGQAGEHRQQPTGRGWTCHHWQWQLHRRLKVAWNQMVWKNAIYTINRALLDAYNVNMNTG